MDTLTVKTSGAAPKLATSIDFDAKVIADAIQYEISGSRATDMQAEALTQDFIEKHNITAGYTSGTFLGFKIPDSAVDEFETFKRR
jgi:hypothetical protein